MSSSPAYWNSVGRMGLCRAAFVVLVLSVGVRNHVGQLLRAPASQAYVITPASRLRSAAYHALTSLLNSYADVTGGASEGEHDLGSWPKQGATLCKASAAPAATVQRLNSVLPEARATLLAKLVQNSSSWLHFLQRGRRSASLQAPQLYVVAPWLMQLYSGGGGNHDHAALMSRLAAAAGRPLFPLDAMRHPNAVAAYGYGDAGYSRPHLDSNRTAGRHYVLLIGLLRSNSGCHRACLLTTAVCSRWQGRGYRGDGNIANDGVVAHELARNEAVLMRADSVPHWVTPCRCGTAAASSHKSSPARSHSKLQRIVLQLEFSDLPRTEQRTLWSWRTALAHFERYVFH